jgi:4-amino-4-deoxy-L-arabinose transferase-like glycosyltransferase
MTLYNLAERLDPADRPLRDAARAVLCLLVVGTALGIGCFYGLGAAGLFDLDEGLYATVARQMVESGDWLVPRVGSVVFFDKPPLTYWLQALSLRLFGVTPFAVRLPSAIAVALTAFVLYGWARRRGLERVGWLAAIIYPLCPLSFGLARQAVMDSLLALWLTAAVIGWIEGYQGDRRGYLLMAVAAGLATLTKGLIGLALPGAAFVLWLLVRRDWQELRRVPWAAGIALYMGIVLPWHLAVWHVSGRLFVQEYVVHHHIERFLGRDFGHHAPVWTYLPLLLVGLFPWSGFAWQGWWQSLRQIRSERRDLDAAWSIWAVWALVVAGFFSLSKSKLPGYIQPAVPALALLAAMRLDSIWRVSRGLTATERGITGVAAALLAGLFLAVGSLGLWWRAQPGGTLWGKAVPADVTVPLIRLAPVAMAIGTLLLIGGVGIVLAWRSPPRVVGTAVAVSLAFVALLVRFALPSWSAYEIQPLHELALRTLPDLRRGEPLVVYGFVHRRPSLLFLLGHSNRICETALPSVLQQTVRNAHVGWILAERKTHLPPLEARFRPESGAGRWMLWRWNAGPASARGKGQE